MLRLTRKDPVLQRRRERLAAEGPEERGARLQQVRSSRAERLATETVEERGARLQQVRRSRAERLATETVEKREARLQQKRDGLLAESVQVREVRLQQMSTLRERLASENAEEREFRLQHMERATGSGECREHLANIQQRAVQAKMQKFHAHMAALEVSRCSTCSEAFPGLRLHPGSTECVRCSRDRHTPKVYSTGNNMHPGPIPMQLQVIVVFVVHDS